MSRRLNFIGILLIVLVCSMTTVFAADTNKTTSYQNKTFGYKMEYPADWMIGKEADNGSVLALKPKSELDKKSDVNTYVMVKNCSNMTLKSFAELNITMLGKSAPDFKLISDKPYLLSNQPGRMYVFSGKERGENFQGIQAFTVYNNKVYIVTYTFNTNNTKNFRKYEEAAKKIISSFKIN